MPSAVSGTSPFEAWLAAAQALLAAPQHKLPNLIVRIAEPLAASVADARLVDELLQLPPTHTSLKVASTIMPASVLKAADWESAASRVLRVVKHGSYFQRFVDYHGDGKVNQLAAVIAGLQPASTYAQPGPMVLERPGRNSLSHIGFPCLSAVQLHRLDGQVHCTAMYRSHHYHSKAFGNFLGLGRLVALVCKQTSLDPGELVVVSTDARLENRISPIRAMLNSPKGATDEV